MSCRIAALRWPVHWILGASLVLVAAAACSGAVAGEEQGAACWDSKDNDGDDLIDCADADCAALAICGGAPDGGPRDRGTREEGVPDRAVPLDQAVADRQTADRAPVADVAPPSSYGTPCDFASNPMGRCADGETVCLPISEQRTGFCSYACPTDNCPAAPSGQRAACIYGVNGTAYCLFVCRVGSATYRCPTGFDCVAVRYDLSHCYPR